MTILDSFMLALGFQVDDTGLEKFEHRAHSVREASLELASVVGGVLSNAFFELFKNFVDTGAEFEKFGVVLGVLYDSADEGKKAMSWISDFAIKTPYQLADLTQAFIRLKAFGLDPTAGALRVAGDTAAAFGRPLMDAVFAIDDAVEGINRPLRTFGISVKEAGNKVTYSYIKNGQMISKTADKTNKVMVANTIMAIWNERYGGAMDKLSHTWSGMWSNMEDQLTRFKQKMMNSGVFDNIKEALGKVIAIIDKASSDGTVEKFGAWFGWGFEFATRTLKGLWYVLDGVISHTVGWKIAIGALSAVVAGVLVSSLSATISLIWKLTSAMLAFDLSTIAVWGLVAGIVLLIDDLWNFYHGNDSLIGQLSQKFPHAVRYAQAALALFTAAIIALKWETLASMAESIAIVALYAAEWWGAAAAVLAATWPIIAVVAALALVGIAVYEVWKHWDVITQKMRQAWKWVVDEIKAGVNWLVDKVLWLSDKAYNLIKSMPGGEKFLQMSAEIASKATGVPVSNATSTISNSVNAGGGVIGRAGSNVSSNSNHSTSTTEIHAPITVVSPDPDRAGESVQRVLDGKRRKVVRNGQSAVAY